MIFRMGLATQVLADFAQTGGGHSYSHRFTQNLDQYQGATFAIGHLVDAFDAGEWDFGQVHALTVPEQPCRFRLSRCMYPQKFDQAIIYPRRYNTETDQPTDAF